ncbi:MAG: nicotinate-nucleotide adenylyltransferase [Bacteroides sp.]|nr:nicotinate-nucleotide adenylyltransferase [Bacteroides sp.]
MDIGIFSGSFNPIHIGHLALANYLCEYAGLDEVWFMVTPHNPLKEESGLMDDRLRLKLVRLAVEGYPRFRASDFEFHLPRPSYTVHTLDALKQAYPADTFHLIIGSDNWMLFPRWYQSERILAENRLLVYPRPGYPVEAGSLPPHVGWVDAPVFEISSTFIRRAMEEGRDVRYFLHPAVYKELAIPGRRPNHESAAPCPCAGR